MGLFGGDMVTVMTPDGRQMQMPSDLAASFPALSPVPPSMAQPPIPPPPPEQPTPQQQAPVPSAAPADVPITSPSQVPAEAPPAPSAPRGPVTSPAEAVAPDLTNPRPPQQQLTNDRLAKMGNAGVYNQGQQAIAEERTAIQREGKAVADQATAVGAKMEAVDTEAARLLEERRRVAEENAQALQSKADEYLRNAKAVADTKIDRTSDHPVLAAIGMLLTSLGASMSGRDPSIAIKQYYESIDRKVAAQMQDLDQKRQGLAVQKEGLAMARQAGMDRLAEMDTYRLGYLEQAKRQIETIRQQTQSPIIAAATDKALAMTTQKQNEILGQAVGREQQKREAQAARAQQAQMHRESLAMQAAQMKQADEHFKIGLAERAQEKADALAAQMLARGEKEQAEKVKQLGELGVVDPSTGEYILSPQGQQKMAQADRMEAAARQAKDPAQAKKLAEQAQMLRQSAMVNDGAIAKNKKGAEEAQNILGTTQQLVNNIDAARQMLNAGPEMWNREEFAQIKVAIEKVKAKFATALGERLSVRALEAFDHVLSIDTDSMFARTFNKGMALKALDTLETLGAQDASVALKNAGVTTPWRPGKAQAAAEFTGQTVDEIGGRAESPVREYVDPIGNAYRAVTGYDSTTSAADAASRRTNERGQASTYGLDPKDDDKVRGLIKRSSGASNEEYGRIVEQLAKPLGNQVEARPSLVRGIGELIRDEDPRLFADVMARVRSAKGEVAAGQVAKLLTPTRLPEPESTSASTADSKQRREYERVRAKLGLPPEPQQMPAMQPEPSVPQNLPAFFATMAPADQARYLAYLRSVGAAGGQQ